VRLDDGRAHAVSLPLQRITLRGASCGAATGGRVLGGFAPER
jgi:hypothetical protein